MPFPEALSTAPGASNPFKALLRAVLTPPAEAASVSTPTLRERQQAGAEAAEILRNAPRPR